VASTSRTIRIGRDADVVAAHFADIGHHERTGVHRKAAFELVDEDGDEVRYLQRSIIGGRSIPQTMVLDRSNPRHLVNAIVDGPLAGGAVIVDIGAVDDSSSTVTATLQLPDRIGFRLIAPLLLRITGRDLQAALEEDRVDLEDGGYDPDRTDGRVT
jgi:hypothetical protein